MRTEIKHLKGTDSLHKILELSFDAEASYEELKCNTLNVNLIEWLTKKQELTTDFIMQILTLLQQYEIAPQSHYTFKGKFGKIWLDAKLKFLKLSDILIIKECNKLDALMVEALSKQIKLGLISVDIQKMYSNYKNKLRILTNPEECKKTMDVLVCN